VLLAGHAGEHKDGMVLAIADFGGQADGGEALYQLFEAGCRFGFVYNIQSAFCYPEHDVKP